jgi:hypothetical protein
MLRMDDRQQDVWVLQNAMNPFPVAAHLALTSGRLVLTLNPMAGEAFTGWLEKATDDPGVKARVAAGETVTLFDIDVSGVDIGWPKQFAGSAMKVPAAGRDWLVALVYPSGGAFTAVRMLIHRSESKAWRKALEAAGAR